MDPSIILAVIAGVAFAASAGLRAFLPLLALGLAARLGALALDPRVDWLASDPALLCLGVATLVEVLGDKIPVVDHALDVAGTFLRPLAASLGAYALFIDLPSPWAQILALALGIGTLGLHLVKAKVRLASTVFTLGAGNPALSAIEDVASAALVALAILAPVLALAALLAIVLAWRKARHRRDAAAAPPEPSRAP